MMQDQEELRNIEACNDHHMQIIIKGKRTKRQRLPSPLRLTMSTTCSGRSSTDNSIGFDVPTTTSNNQELRNGREEEEDMANCLILLAQGHNTPKPSHKSSHVASPHHHNKGGGLYLYECKTCNRCFPSFQALGGHRASHKKFKSSNEENLKQGVTSFVNEDNNHHSEDHDDHGTTSTTLTLQLSNTLYRNTSTRNINAKSKVHECSICGAEFTSGQALGGHMRRHRSILNGAIANGASSEISETKTHKKDVLNLDLNLPAPEDDHRESKLFPFQAKENVIAFSSATSLVDCHY